MRRSAGHRPASAAQSALHRLSGTARRRNVGPAGSRGGKFVRVSIRPTLFSGSFLDRRAELRDDPEWIAVARADPGTQYVLTAGPQHLVKVGSAMDVELLRNDDD